MAIISKKDNFKSIAILLEKGDVAIPDLFFQYYAKLGLSETEAMILLHLFRWRQVEQNRFPSMDKLSLYTNLDQERVKNVIASLIEKKLLSIEPYFNEATNRWQNGFTAGGVWNRILEIMEDESKEQEASLAKEKRVEEASLAQVYRAFEKEFGRPLSPLESNQIAEWCLNGHFAPELVLEALRRAVLRGALNFRYIDSILRDWARKNVHNLLEAAALEERLANSRHNRPRQPANKGKRDKYRDLYLS